MRYVSAYLLCALSGKEPGAAEVEKVLSSVGVEVDKEKLKKVLSELKGKNLEEIISKGKEKLASMPSGGSAAAAPAAAAAAPAAGSPKKEAKKEEKKEESEDEDEDMGFGLFD